MDSTLHLKPSNFSKITVREQNELKKESPAVEIQKRMRRSISKSYLVQWNEFKKKQKELTTNK